MRRFSILAAGLLAASVVSAQNVEVPRLQADVNVFTDANGIPTIVGETEADVTFVQGYLHARDRFFQMDFLRRVASGSLAELVGTPALDSDIQLRTLGLRRAAWASFSALDTAESAWLKAYADGVNHWLATNPLPPEYGGLELSAAEPWSAVDSLVIGKLLAFQLSFDQSLSAIGNTVRIGTYQAVGEAVGFDGTALFLQDLNPTIPVDDRVSIPDFFERIGIIVPDAGQGEASKGAGAGLQQAAESASMDRVDPKLVELGQRYLERVEGLPFLGQNLDLGSNWWAVAGEHTATGYPLFANDPHLGLTMPPIFMNENLVIRDEDMAVSGVVFPGAPVNAQGCTPFLCWGSTVNRLDVTDVFQDPILVNNFGLPTHTIHKGVPERILYVFQSFFANTPGNGEVDDVNRVNVGFDAGGITFIVPRRNNGPILELMGDSALTVQYTGWGPTFELSAFRTWARARSQEDFELGLRDFAFGSQNFLYADVEGNIAYYVGGEMPLRADLQNDLTADGGRPPWFIRDGSGALNHEWLIDPDPQPGQTTPYALIPREEMPRVVNPPWGYIANANNDPVGTSLDGNPLNQLRPGGNGIYYLNTSYADLRMGRIDRELQDLVARGNVSIDDMKALQANNELLDAELLLPFLLQAFENATADEAWPGLTELAADERIQEAMGRLADWDFSSPTGLAGGFDPGGDPGGNSTPSPDEIANSVATTIYSVWRGEVIANTIDATLSAVGLGDSLPSSTLAWRALVNQLRAFPLTQGEAPSGLSYFNVPEAPTPADARDAVLLASLQGALDRLAGEPFANAFEMSEDQNDYRWGKLHRVVFDHPLDSAPFNVPGAGGFSDVGENLPGVARSGGFEAVDASSHSARARSENAFTFGSGPARRNVAVVTPEGPEAEEIVPGGRSGLFLSPFYTNQLRLWLVNDYLPLTIGEDQAGLGAAEVTTFSPR
ncbi:penicillin acylase family protein [Wenzhouxiangella limi]|uniref:Penicillin acylase family protein n=1 Tax=Wenzhouxiangella limi TaxID=2707351 RepID=A0A845UZM2_9GAMM|nr:penicillin acylase family protein [Wenzhouxiangella limi]NDY94506.1 penicillin acylase family protein [Wenzhouxiangella limi]